MILQFLFSYFFDDIDNFFAHIFFAQEYAAALKNVAPGHASIEQAEQSARELSALKEELQKKREEQEKQLKIQQKSMLRIPGNIPIRLKPKPLKKQRNRNLIFNSLRSAGFGLAFRAKLINRSRMVNILLCQASRIVSCLLFLLHL